MLTARSRILPVIVAPVAFVVSATVSVAGAADAYRPGNGAYGEATVRNVVLVQSYSQSGNSALIPQSVALRNALRYASGGNGLGICLRRGSRPVYVVKVKKGSRIFRVRVDARNGRVLGQ